MRKFVLPGVIAVAAVAALALLAFGVSRNNDTSSIDAKVARGAYPLAPNYRMPLRDAQLVAARLARQLPRQGRRAQRVRVLVRGLRDRGAAARAGAEAARRHNATLLGVTYEDAAPSTEGFVRNYHVDYPVVRDVSGNFVRSFGTDAGARDVRDQPPRQGRGGQA